MKIRMDALAPMAELRCETYCLPSALLVPFHAAGVSAGRRLAPSSGVRKAQNAALWKMWISGLAHWYPRLGCAASYLKTHVLMVLSRILEPRPPVSLCRIYDILSPANGRRWNAATARRCGHGRQIHRSLGGSGVLLRWTGLPSDGWPRSRPVPRTSVVAGTEQTGPRLPTFFARLGRLPLI